MQKLIGILMGLVLSASLNAEVFDSKRLDYELRAGEWKADYEVMSFFVLPHQKLKLIVNHEAPNTQSTKVTVRQDDKEFIVASNEWDFQAPANPGLVTLLVTPDKKKTATLNFFVMYPANAVKNGKLNGYRIGEYPKQPYKGLDIYLPPKGYVEVTKESQEIWLSPHYQLKQFVSKQGGNYPRYVVLQTRLLRKLEFLTEVVNKKGIKTQGFHIMSGFRTPYYNSLIKNKLWSRHQWGGASDIYIDENPKDGVMDDLNKDGKVNVKDAIYLASLIEEYYTQETYKPFIGGLGIYKANSAHGPFIHVDVRGFKARW